MFFLENKFPVTLVMMGFLSKYELFMPRKQAVTTEESMHDNQEDTE